MQIKGTLRRDLSA